MAEVCQFFDIGNSLMSDLHNQDKTNGNEEKITFKHNVNLTPEGLSDFFGQKRAVSYLEHIIKSAKQRQSALGHILFSGPPGLGKTALANAVAHEMGTNITIIMSTAITNPFDLANTLINLEAGDILFLDEIHGLDKKIGEVFYTAIQDFKLNISEDNTIDLNPFTLIGATTASGKIDLPLHERFEHHIELRRYKEDEIVNILNRAAGKLDISLSPEAVKLLSTACQGTPRTANHMIKHVRDYAVNNGISVLSEDNIKDVFSLIGVYEDGLNEKSIIYLKTLKKMDRPSSTKSIAKMMNENISYIENIIEPWLVYRGYIELSRRGRVITESGKRLSEIEID